MITGVALIPLSSQSEAQKTIEQVRQILKKSSSSGKEEKDITDSETSEDEGEPLAPQTDGLDEEARSISTASESKDREPDRRPSAQLGESSVAEDIFNKKGAYGRFAERWFSKKGWSVDKRRNLGMSTNDDPTRELSHPNASKEVQDKSGNPQGVEDRAEREPMKSNVAYTLLPKLLRTTRLLLCSESFYFSYDYDITRRVGSNPARSKDLPLHKIVDPLVCTPSHIRKLRVIILTLL